MCKKRYIFIYTTKFVDLFSKVTEREKKGMYIFAFVSFVVVSLSAYSSSFCFLKANHKKKIKKAKEKLRVLKRNCHFS